MLRKVFAKFTVVNARNGVKKALVPMLFAHNMSSTQTPCPSQVITKNLELHFCNETARRRRQQLPEEKKKQSDLVDDDRPLAVIFSWLMAKKKHIMKFSDFYKQQGFDVLTVSITPFQLVWPVKGAQVVAEDLLKFLVQGDQHQRSLLIHGFSVGGYVYGELLVKMRSQPDKYGGVADRIVGQIFDSAVDFNGIPVGMSKAITRNVLLQKSMETYLRYHMKTFYSVATQHYLRSSDHFHNNEVRTPALFLFSRDDPVGTADGNLRVVRKWEEQGMKVYAKCWENSPHVSHLHRHPDEYMEELRAFLERIGLLNVQLADAAKQRASKL